MNAVLKWITLLVGRDSSRVQHHEPEAETRISVMAFSPRY